MKKIMLAAILLLCVGLLAMDLVRSGPVPGEKTPPPLDTSARQITTYVYDDDGTTLLYLIKAPAARQEGNDRLLVEKPIITFYDRDQQVGRPHTITAVVTADNGQVSGTRHDGQEESFQMDTGELYGNVRVVTAPQDPDNSLVLTTSYIEIDYQRRIIGTPEPVTIIGGDRRIDSLGMDADPDLKRVDLRRDVKIDMPMSTGERLRATSPGAVRVEQFDLTQEVGRREITGDALEQYKIRGVTEAVRFVFEETAHVPGRVTIQTGQATMKADRLTLYAYQESGQGNGPTDKVRKRVKPIYMVAGGRVAITEQVASIPGQPTDRREAYGDRFVWLQKTKAGRVVEEVTLLGPDAPDPTNPLRAKYVTTERSRLEGEEESHLALPGIARQVAMDIQCEEKMVFLRSRPVAGNGPYEQFARFSENVVVNRTRVDKPEAYSQLRTDRLLIRFEPVPLEGNRSQIGNGMQIKQIEADGAVRLVEPEREGWGRRLVWTRNARHADGWASRMRTVLTGERGFPRPGIRFKNAGSQLTLGEDAKKPQAERNEQLTLTCSEIDGRLVFDQGLVDTKGVAQDDRAVATHGVIIVWQEFGDDGAEIDEPVTLLAETVTMVVEPPRDAAGIAGGVESERRVAQIIAGGGVVITSPQMRGEGDRLVWSEEETADGLLRTTELFGTPQQRPGLEMNEDKEETVSKTVIRSTEKIVFTQALFRQETSPLIKEQRSAQLIGDVHYQRDTTQLKAGTANRVVMTGDKIDVLFPPTRWTPPRIADTRQFDTVTVRRGTERVKVHYYLRGPEDPLGWTKKLKYYAYAEGDKLTWTDSGKRSQTATLESMPANPVATVEYWEQGVRTGGGSGPLLKDIPMSGAS